MDKDKLILIALGGILLVLLMALFGTVAVVGFVIFTQNNVSPETAQDVEKSILDDVSDVPANSNIPADDSQLPPVEELPPAQEEKPKPKPAVCGNDLKEEGEQCELNSQCLAEQVCTACKCVAKPVEPAASTKLENIVVEGADPLPALSFYCAPNFEGKRGLAVKIINFKNTGTTDYSFNGILNIRLELNGEYVDSVNTKSAYKFLAKAGKTASIYQNDIARPDAPFIFAGTSPGALKLTIKFGTDKYVEYNYALKANDFSKAGCL